CLWGMIVKLSFMAWNVNVIACLHGMDMIACLHDMVDKLAFMAWLLACFYGMDEKERISKKGRKTKPKRQNQARNGKAGKRQSPVKSKPKCRKVNPSQPRQTRSQKSRKTSLGTKLVKSLNLFKEEKEENKEKGKNCQIGKEIPQGLNLPTFQRLTSQGPWVQQPI
ncbi:hypothetical protein Tco_0532387, partial [Tanacetum coccineum]